MGGVLVTPAMTLTRSRVATPISHAARVRVAMTYFWRHGRWPDLDRPQTFTELVQWRKLNDRDARLPVLADKVRVKGYVADAIGREWVIPTLWSGGSMPAAILWQGPCVVKSRHGCNQNIFLHQAPRDYAGVRRQANSWTRSRYGWWLDEWLYGEITPGILIEPYIGEPGVLPLDYKFYVFGGRVTHVQVHLGRGARHRWILFDRDWRRVSAPSRDADPARPRSFAAMAAAAETLAGDFDFVRVDLYDVATGPKFGEMTFYPGSGLDRFDPVGLDLTLGALWRLAMVQVPVTQPELTLGGGMIAAVA